jgi:antitoxin VapB
MAIQIANPHVVEKIDRLARSTGLSKTAAVERAVDRLLGETRHARQRQASDIAVVLEQFDQVPERGDRGDPLEWDELGLPK